MPGIIPQAFNVYSARFAKAMVGNETYLLVLAIAWAWVLALVYKF